MKPFLTDFFFWLFGASAFSFTLIGFIFGILGILSLYFLVKNIGGRKVAIISALLLSTSPLFLSVGIFSLYDYLLTVFILAGLYFYSQGRYALYAAFGSFAVLIKETGLIFPFSLILVEFFHLIGLRRQLKERFSYKTLFLLFPVLISISWYWFLALHKKSAWSDWIFAETAEQGGFYTVFNNVARFHIFNAYTKQHILQLLFLNFNWIYWLLILCAFSIVLTNSSYLSRMFLFIRKRQGQSKTVAFMWVFCMLYVLTVLTFQTYTIPRYALPLMPFVFIATSFAIKILIQYIKKKTFTIFLFSFLSLTISVSLFYSLDPISIRLWGITELYGSPFYGLDKTLAGNDGIAYNMQYLFFLKKRAETIVAVQNGVVRMQQDLCLVLFPDENTDYKAVRFLKLRHIEKFFSCMPILQQ